MRFTEHMDQLIEARSNGELGGIWRYNGKLEGRRLAIELDVRVPELLAGPFPLEEWPGEPPITCVVKPVDGCTGRGVLPLMWIAGEWAPLWGAFDLRPWSGWQRWQLEELERHRDGPAPYRGPFIVEELVKRDTLAASDDWKCYCIHGRVAWIRQLRHTGPGPRDVTVQCWARKYFEALPYNFEALPYDVLTNHRKAVARMKKPRHARELVDAAERVAGYLLEHTGSPFVRIDFYEDELGPVFGELTPHPSGGKDAYRPEWDEMLGQLWSEGA